MVLGVWVVASAWGVSFRAHNTGARTSQLGTALVRLYLSFRAHVAAVVSNNNDDDSNSRSEGIAAAVVAASTASTAAAAAEAARQHQSQRSQCNHNHY